MVYVYITTALLTFTCFVLLLSNFEVKKVNFYFLMLVLLMTISNGGYLALALSGNLEEAILANKIAYVGGIFVPPVTLFLICAICNYRLRTWLKFLLVSYSMFVYALALTIGSSNFYYADVYLDSYNGATVLGRTYGIGHNLFYVTLYGHIIAQIILLIYTFYKKRAVSRYSIWTLIGMVTVNIILFIAGRSVNSALEIMPIAYTIDSWIMLYMYQRCMNYNFEDNITASLKKQDTYGYIMFDKKLNYIGCNEIALEIFPALSQCIVDRGIRKIQELDKISQWLDAFTETNTVNFSHKTAEKHYECHIEKIWNRKKIKGYVLELREDTDKWKYMNLLAKHNSDLEKFQAELEQKVDEQTVELRLRQERINGLFLRTVTALSEAVDAKDRYTSGHSTRVAQYARMIARQMGKTKEEQDEIYRAGLLHDVGKIRIPDEIINKPGKLTDEEYNIIKIHPVTGYHILKGISTDDKIALAAKYHHERYDGKGYPHGLSGEKIPEVARILGIADSYDAMASNRSYRKALPQEIVRSEIEKGKGTQFDPDIADIMLRMIDEDKEYTLKQTDSMHRKILIVDDEEKNHQSILEIMQNEPMYEMVSALSGKQALELIKIHDFDLIILDIKMSEMNGLETLKKIREQYQTPVVLMTGDRTLDVDELFSPYNYSDYITKPFHPLLVKEVVHTMTKLNHL